MTLFVRNLKTLKCIGLVFALGVLALSLGGQNGSVAAQQRILRVVNATATGSTVAVQIELTAQGNENAIGFSLTFPTTQLTNPQAVVGSGATAASFNVNTNQAAQGRLGVALAFPTGQAFVAGTRQVAVITFTVPAGASGAAAIGFGNQPVAQEIADTNANPLTATFTGGTVTIGGSQCSYAIAPANQTFVSAGGTGTVNVTTAAGCAWTAASNAPFITVASGASGSGNGTVGITVAANPTVQVRTGTLTIAGQTFTVTQSALVTSVSAASFSAAVLSSESIVAAFGDGLATDVRINDVQPLPTTLVGTTVRVRDSAGTTRDAGLFFVAPGQINYLIPANSASGAGTVTITAGNGKVSTGAVQIANVAPGFFTANASGQGYAAAVAFRVRGDGSQSTEAITTFNSQANRFDPIPIDLGPASDQVFIILFGTGFRFNTGLSAVNVRIGGVDSEVLYAGLTPGLIGLDQANVRLSRNLIGRGDVDVVMTADGRAANTVRINVK